VERIKRDRVYWLHNLKVECAFVDCDTINQILKRNGISGDIGLLSIDIDGNDYWVWKAIDIVQPRIVICEYNSTFGWHTKVTVPYDATFVRSQAHFSHLYYGASIAALDQLAKDKGYALVGSNQAGNNLFFVRSDLVDGLPTFTPEQAYRKAQFREARNVSGQLMPLNFEQRVVQIADMHLYDIKTDRLIPIRELDIIKHQVNQNGFEE